MEFDLRQLAKTPQVRLSRRIHIVAGTFATLLGVLVVALAIVRPLVVSRAIHWSQIGAILFAFEVFLTGAFALVFMLSGPGPTSVEVSDKSVRLNFRGGRLREFWWTDPAMTLRFASTTDGHDAPHSKVKRVVLMGGIPSRNPITPEAFTEILRQAEVHNLVIQRRPWPSTPALIETTVSWTG